MPNQSMLLYNLHFLLLFVNNYLLIILALCSKDILVLNISYFILFSFSFYAILELDLLITEQTTIKWIIYSVVSLD